MNTYTPPGNTPALKAPAAFPEPQHPRSIGALFRNLAAILLGLAGIALILYFDQQLRDNTSLPELGQNMSYGLLFTVGLLTGFHCVGMCGPLIIGYTAKTAAAGRPTYTSHLLYGTGKTLSYTEIGAAFGGLGSIIAFTPFIRGAVGIAAGVFLTLFGLPNRAGRLPFSPSRASVRNCRHHASADHSAHEAGSCCGHKHHGDESHSGCGSHH